MRTDDLHDNLICEADRSPAVSVIIPVFNGGRRIEHTVALILDGDFSDLELLLVDDGSCDGTPEACLRLEQSDPRVRYIRRDHRGAGAARNTGIESARGTYIAFIDDDDIVTADYLSRLYGFAEDNELDWVACAHRLVWQESSDDTARYQLMCAFESDSAYHGEQARRVAAASVFYRPKGTNLASCAMGIYRRSILISEGIRMPEDISYGEDTLFNYEYVHYLTGFGYISEPLYDYVLRDDSASRSMYNRGFIPSEHLLLTHLDDLRRRLGDNWSREMLMYASVQFFDIFTLHILPQEPAMQRSMCREFDQMLHDDQIQDIWRRIRMRHVFVGRLKPCLPLMRMGCYRTLYLLWRINKAFEKTFQRNSGTDNADI